MSLNAPLIAELQHETATTRKCLERLPEKEFGWKPHEKSMTLGRLAQHVAEMTGWITVTINQDELDFGKEDYKPKPINTKAELLELFDEETRKAVAALEGATDENLMQNWTLRNGDQVFFTMPRIGAIRAMAMNHIVHHRGQLSVYMRLKNVPLPQIYGPSADEGTM